MREVAGRYGGNVEVLIYQAGRDMGYVAKYGPIMRGTLIINGGPRIERLNRSIIERAIADAVNGQSAC